MRLHLKVCNGCTLNDNMSNKYWIIGLYQMLGGLAGLVMHFMQFVSIPSGQETMRNYIILLGGFAFFMFSIIAGFYMFFYRPYGIILSRVCQSAQLVTFSVLGFKYSFFTGILGGFYISFSPSFYIDVMYDVGTNFYLYFLQGSDSASFGINLLALLLVLYLYENPFHQKKDSLDKRMEELDMDKALKSRTKG